MLRLVHPAREGQGTDPPKRRRYAPAASLSLTDAEIRCLRAAIRGLARTRYGSLAALARAIDVCPTVLTRKKRPGPALAIAIWRASGVPMERLLRGGIEAVPSPKEGGAS